MSGNPLMIVFLGLFFTLAPALMHTHAEAVSDGEDTGPARISTMNAEKEACRSNSVRVAGGGRFGCVENRDGRAPTRRIDKTGAVFVSVGN